MNLSGTQQVFARLSTPVSSEAEPHQPDLIRRFGGTRVSGLLKRCSRLFSPDWATVLWSRQANETVVAALGTVEIRQSPGGCLAVTLVKGDCNPARGTALLRLAKYLSGDNQLQARLDAERPVLQQRRAPRLWQVGIRLTGIDDVRDAPPPCGRKVKPVAQQPTTWAVLTTMGRPSEHKLAKAEIAVLDAISRTRWFACGQATVRIYRPTSILHFATCFEVAVPVTCQPEAPPVDCSSPVSRPANPPSLAVH